MPEIKAFKDLDEKTVKKQVSCLVRENREKFEFFYLLPDKQIGFTNRMGVIFSNTIRLPKENLETLRESRKGRLSKIPYEHFREKLSHFFCRYAYNDWYILNKDEVQKYKYFDEINPNGLFEWQKQS